MVTHWLGVPVNGYLGSGYGADAMSLLQKPMSSGLGDAFLQKMERDVPVISILPSGAVNVYMQDRNNQSKDLIINVLDRLVVVDESGVVS